MASIDWLLAYPISVASSEDSDSDDDQETIAPLYYIYDGVKYNLNDPLDLDALVRAEGYHHTLDEESMLRLTEDEWATFLNPHSDETTTLEKDVLYTYLGVTYNLNDQDDIERLIEAENRQLRAQLEELDRLFESGLPPWTAT